MASLAPKIMFNTSVRAFSSTPQQSFFFKKLYRLPTKAEHCTGRERKEYELIQAGNDDPWNEKICIRKANSTKADPNIVFGCHERRLMGCRCTEDAATIGWWYLWKGEPTRCMCGHWFKLEYAPAVEETGNQTAKIPA